ncbi:ArsR/SmtB family transcription factor [Streptomyces nondiastaticus]|uniref:ArsR/SmtB family transcription factor n=1 Tax=Streptomyces nondiastaticus TaxID=3154512 RepID=A0ABW6U7Q2_9ACTN
MHAFDVLGDPVRRRILELLAEGERTSGAVTAVIREEFAISQPAVSQHLRVLRESGFTTVRAEGARRLYTIDAAPLREVDVWLERFRGFWEQRLDALGTELARGKRARRLHDGTQGGAQGGGNRSAEDRTAGKAKEETPGG